jgi:hypothetical protein
MKFKMRHIIVGVSLTTGFVLNGALALNIFAQQTNIEAFSKHGFCKNQLNGERFARTELFLGLTKPDGSVVTEKEFQRFINKVVTPRFPDGLTLLAATGQFKDSNGKVTKEGSSLLVLLYPFNSQSSRRIQQIREAYINTFQQESVLRVDEQSCVSF